MIDSVDTEEVYGDTEHPDEGIYANNLQQTLMGKRKMHFFQKQGQDVNHSSLH